MRESKSDSPSSDRADLVASLLARIDQLVAQVAARDERIAELLAQVKALNARIAELEAKLGGPPKTPDNSSLPPSRGQKANADPPNRPIITRIELFRAVCPCCKGRVTASAPADMPAGTPFGPGITSMIAYLHGCQMIGFKRLTEVCEGLFGLTISRC